MHTYEIRIRRNGDFFCDEELDIVELGTWVTVGVRNDYDHDAYTVYVDRTYNTPYLETSEGFYDTDFHTTLEDEENDIAFDIRW